MLIDEADLPLISTLKWHIGSTGYAVWRGVKDGKKQTVRMHRLIMNAPKGLVVDHINHNTFDNRRSNLRVCTQAENTRNRKDPGKGYNRHRQSGNWNVETCGVRLSGFKTEDEAKSIVELLHSGGTYVRPERTHCKHGHSLDDAYFYNGAKHCKVCQAIRGKKYYSKSYKPNPHQPVLVCPRGHDKTITRTANGDCRLCAIIRTKERISRVRNA